MDLDLESTRSARRQFLRILLTQLVVSWAPIFLISVLLIIGEAQNISQISLDRFQQFYINVRLEPNDGLAGLAVIVAVVLALSLDSSLNNYHQFRYSEFLYAYNIKKLLLVLSGIIANLITLFSLIDLMVDLFTYTGEVGGNASFASVLVILSAIAISILSAARVKHREIEGISIRFQIKKEEENLKNILSVDSRRKKWRGAPWQRFRIINTWYILFSMVIVVIGMLAIIYAGTRVLWNPWQIIGLTLLHLLLIFVAPLYSIIGLFYIIRSRQFMALLAIVPLVLISSFLSIFLVISGSQFETGYPALDLLWAIPAFMLFIGIISIILPSRHYWPWWSKIFYPVNKVYYLIEQDFQQSRLKVTAVNIKQLSEELEKMRTVED